MRIKHHPINIAIIFILATVPLLFGARHPIIQGSYTSLILLTCGIWGILNYDDIKPNVQKKSNLVLYILILFIIITSIPLPFTLVKLLSPVRAGFIEKAGELLQLNETVTSLSYFAPGTRFSSVFILGLLVYYFCMAVLLRRDTFRRVVLWTIMIVGSFEALYGLLQVTMPTIGILWLPSDISAEGCARGTIIYRNQYAAFLNMCWPLTLTLGILLYHPIISRFQALKKREKTVKTVERISLLFQKAALPFWSTGFMILAVIFSRSRAGILVMLLTASFLLLALPFSKKMKTIAAGTMTVFVITYGGMIGFQSVTERFLAFYQGALGRFSIWLDSISILKDHLLTGSGIGTYKFLSPLYMNNVSDNVWLDFVHNEYLELSIELGLPMAIVIFTWLIWKVWHTGAKVIKSRKGIDSFIWFDDQSIIAIGSFSALIGLLLHGFVDFVWHLPANAIYAVTISAMLYAVLPSGQTDDE